MLDLEQALRIPCMGEPRLLERLEQGRKVLERRCPDFDPDNALWQRWLLILDYWYDCSPGLYRDDGKERGKGGTGTRD